jgi:type IV pilus assembly protein PilA
MIRGNGEEYNMRKQKGFSLIELLIVVAIILIIAAIAIPNLLRSKMAANEASAVASTRTLVTAQATYNTTYQSYADKLSELGPVADATVGATSTGAGLIDDVLAKADGTAWKSGYKFTLLATPKVGAETAFTISSQPQSVSTGNRSFFTDESGVIRGVVGQTAATATSPALQ